MHQKTILCYGDSNTWGYVPLASHDEPKQRYPRDIRWPGVLQTLLGNQFHVVEEALNSRTTNIDYNRPPDRNGKTYLPSCLYSHAPIDLVILALGGNDTKTYFNRTAQDITNGLADLIDTIQLSDYGPSLQSAPKILILSPTQPLDIIETYKDEHGVLFMQGAVAKTKEMLHLYAALAKEKNCAFLDLSEQVKPSLIDGVHLDEKSHKRCAELIANKIKSFIISG